MSVLPRIARRRTAAPPVPMITRSITDFRRDRKFVPLSADARDPLGIHVGDGGSERVDLPAYGESVQHSLAGGIAHALPQNRVIDDLGQTDRKSTRLNSSH